MLLHLGGKGDRRSQWLKALIERRGVNRAAVVALANETARIAWVLPARGEAYRAARVRPGGTPGDLQDARRLVMA